MVRFIGNKMCRLVKMCALGERWRIFLSREHTKIVTTHKFIRQ
jgi:hypothetical protein